MGNDDEDTGLGFAKRSTRGGGGLDSVVRRRMISEAPPIGRGSAGVGPA